MRSPFAISVVIAASAGAAVAMMWPGDRPPDPSAAPPAPRPGEAAPSAAGPDDQRLDTLERDVRRLRAELRQRDAQASRQTIPTDPPVEDLALARELEEAEFDLLDEIFEDERVDLDWSVAHADRMSSGFASARVTGSTLQSLDCKRSFCRAELAHASVQAQDIAAAVLPSTDGWNTRGSIHFVEDEQGFRSVYYVAREGQSLPSVDEEL